MDAIGGPRRSKTLAHFRNQDIDRISVLQDDILHHILSSLSAKDVTRTSVLSKRWLNLQTTSPTVVLVDGPCLRTRIDLQVVNRVLTHHDPSDIKILTLVLSTPVDLSHLESWIQTAKTHNVQKLNLDLNLVDNRNELPKMIYNCQSLNEMKLSMRTTLKAPTCTQLSGLRCLHLSKILFYTDGSLKRLLTGCPVLEELVLVDCGWENVGSVSVIMPMLRKLIIDQNLAEGDILSSDISFTVPNLSSFYCSTDLKVTFSLDSQVSLESAYISLMITYEDADIYASCITKLLDSIQNVKYLSIPDNSFACILYGEINLPTFYSLTRLEVKSTLHLFQFHHFLMFLEKSPKLEFLELLQGITYPSPLFIHILEDIVPSCFHSSLKKIRFENFGAKVEELGVLEFLLKNATVLERMLIYFSNELLMEPQKLQVVIQHIETCPRGSERLLIYYSDKLLTDI